MNRIFRAWNRFFFIPTSPATLAAFRFFVGIVAFISVLGVFPYRDIFYGAEGIVRPEVMERLYAGRWMVLSQNLMPLHDPGMALFLVGLMVASLMLSLGLFTRIASVLVAVGIYSMHNRNGFNTNAGDVLLRMNCLVLVFADSGACFSMDRWIDRRRGRQSGAPRLVSPWPVRVLQLQLCYLYVSTVALKLMGPSWRDGTAMYYALRYLELQRFSFKYLFYYLWQIKIATWGTLVLETMAGTLIWVRRLRYPILLMAFGLHEGINLAMQFPTFQYVMMANLVLFIYPEDLDRWVAKLGDYFGGRSEPPRQPAISRPDDLARSA